MNRTPLILAAVLPFAATAGQGGDLKSKINLEKLQQDIQASQVMGATVKTQNGQEAGDVEDLVLSKNGRIEAVLINADEQASAWQGNATGQNQNNASSQRLGETTNEGLTKVKWSQVKYDPQDQSLRLTSSGGQSQSATAMRASTDPRTATQSQQRTQPAQASGSSTSGASSMSASASGQSRARSQQSSGIDTYRTSELVGMEVHLSDAVSFGEVEDVLINEQNGKASALVVDTWEGLDKQTYALPVELNAVNLEDKSVTYNYTESEVIALQEFQQRQ